jgi:hypothetical protein
MGHNCIQLAYVQPPTGEEQRGVGTRMGDELAMALMWPRALIGRRKYPTGPDRSKSSCTAVSLVEYSLL